MRFIGIRSCRSCGTFAYTGEAGLCFACTFQNARSKAAQQGPVPRYFARLDAAEAVCEWVDEFMPPPEESRLYGILAAWRKAKADSEEEQ